VRYSKQIIQTIKALQHRIDKQKAELRKLKQQLQEETSKRQLLEENLRTSDKLLEKKIHNCEAKMRATFAAMTDIVLVINTRESQLADIEILPTNLSHLHEPGMALMSQTVEQFFQNPTAELWFGQVRQALETQQRLIFDYSLSVEGREVWFSAIISPLSENSVLWIARDISDRKQTEERLRLLERAIAASNNGILICDAQSADYPIVYTNSGFERITGYQASEVIGKNCRILQGIDKAQPALETLRHAIASGTDTQVVLRNYRKDGSLFWNDFCLTPVHDATGRLTHFIGIQTDISDRVAAEQALRESKAALERQMQRVLLCERITQEIRSSLNPQHVFQTAATQIGQAFGVNRCLIHAYIEHPIPRIPLVAEYKQAELESLLTLNIEIPVTGNPHIELLLTQDKAIACDNVYTEPLLNAASSFCHQLGMKSMLAVRTSYRGEPNGVIDIHQYDRFRHWQDEEIELLEAVAAQVGIAIAQAHLLEQETQRRIELDQKNQRLQREIQVRERAEDEIFFLVSTTQAIAEADDFHTALSIILRSCCQTIGWDFGEAWIPNQDASFLENSPSWYASDSKLETFRTENLTLKVPPNVGLLGRVWASQQPEWLEDVSVEQYPVFLRSDSAAAAGLKASFAVPISVNNQVLVILVFFKKAASPYQSHWVGLINTVATQLGSLIQRKQTEEALRIAEEKYHSIVDNAVEGIFQATPSGQYLSANPALARIYGYDSPEDLMTNIQDIYHQLYVNPNSHQDFVAAIAANDRVKDFESLVYRKDGTVIWISENARAVRDERGTLLFYEGIVSDITERKLIEEALKFEQDQTKKLLLNLFPAAIAKRLQEGEIQIAEKFDEVSVLFADLVGFTEFSSQKKPEELVSILNVIFSKFDELAQQYGLEKIKTIGDAYMVVGGLPTFRPDHAEAIAQMALAMQDAIANINTQINQAFQLRIGINTGPVVAGVIGLNKFIYDLWGDTVNTASRMEANGIPGEIQVTATTYERLKEQFFFAERGRIPIKGKGQMITYFLRGRNP
jgi:adenylate cyclase